jgi:hypothetical protein
MQLKQTTFDKNENSEDRPTIIWRDKLGRELNSDRYSEATTISITGRAYPEFAHLAWQPFIESLTEFFDVKIAKIIERPKLEVIFDLDFYNTSSSIFITVIFGLLQANWSKCDITVKWYYSEEERDESDGEMYRDSSSYKKINIQLVDREN